jgi:hypothetical protein
MACCEPTRQATSPSPADVSLRGVTTVSVATQIGLDQTRVLDSRVPERFESPQRVTSSLFVLVTCRPVRLLARLACGAAGPEPLKFALLSAVNSTSGSISVVYQSPVAGRQPVRTHRRRVSGHSPSRPTRTRDTVSSKLGAGTGGAPVSAVVRW